MTQHAKHITLLLLIGALVSLILLSASLSNLQLLAGAPFPGGGNSESDSQSSTNLPPTDTYSLPVLKGFFALVLLILMIYVPVRLLALVNIKKVLKWLLALVVLFLIVISIPPVTPGRPNNLPEESSEITASPSFEYPTTPLGRPPQALIWLVIIGFVLGAGFVVIQLLKRKLFPVQVEDQLSREAESAVRALNAGGDLRNVILRCYLQMTRALQVEQGIERNDNMTVQEFEQSLVSRGFPAAPVHQLTRLFEKVRYGKQPTMEEDEKTAVESLNEIIWFGRSERN